jgi:hypothetical protein
MGGSGGGGFSGGRNPSELRSEVEESLRRSQLESDVNSYLSEQLAWINNRDVELVNERLEAITEVLGDRIVDLDRLLFGGSVAKHTYVDGLSDVDALVIVKPEALDADTPEALKTEIEQALLAGLNRGEIDEVNKGFAVTVKYADGNEIQLLPAVERGDGVEISDKAGTGWSFIRPRAFQERLSEVNRQQDGRVVPTIKLAKAIVETLPEAQQPGGYHMEALAVEAFSDYAGPRGQKAMLTRFFESARDRIRHPIADSTGQSERLDEVFGPADSDKRQQVAAALGQIADKMNSASSMEEWRQLFE